MAASASERHLRDARITTIYEGTSQLQIVAAVRGVSSGTFATYVAPFEETEYDDPLLGELKGKLIEAKETMLEAIAFVKQQSSSYLDYSGRRLVDSAIAVIVGHLFLGQGVENDRKKRVARHFIESQLAVLRMNMEQVLTGDTTAMDEYELLAGPVPVVE